MTTFNFSKIMIQAWSVARHMKNVTGGKAVDYIGAAMKQSWSEAKARAAKQAAEIAEWKKEDMQRKSDKQAFFNNRDVEDLSVTLKRVELARDSFYGQYYTYIFSDENGQSYDWTTTKGISQKKIDATDSFVITFNIKSQYLGGTNINYVTVK